MAKRINRSISQDDRNSIDRLGSIVSFARGKKIFRKAQVARQIYKVESGCVGTYIDQGNRRFITEFYYPGDYFGLEMTQIRSVSAEAIVSSRILVIGQRALSEASKTHLVVARFMLEITKIELGRAQDRSVMLRTSAKERVANLLFYMKKRGRQKEVDLLMTRQDIADYLNLSIESVSRTLSELENDSVITSLTQRRIAVHIRKRLAA